MQGPQEGPQGAPNGPSTRRKNFDDGERRPPRGVRRAPAADGGRVTSRSQRRRRRGDPDGAGAGIRRRAAAGGRVTAAAPAEDSSGYFVGRESCQPTEQKRAVVTEPCASRGTGSDDQVSTRFGAARPPVRSYIRRPDRRRRGEGDGGAGGGAPSSSRPAPAAVRATGGAVEEVAVDVGGDADARVAEHLRHGLEVHASGEGEGGGRMAELVRVPVTDAGTPTRRRAPAATSLRSTSSRSNASSRVAAIALRRSADRRVCVRSRGGRASGRRRGGQSPVRVAGCAGLVVAGRSGYRAGPSWSSSLRGTGPPPGKRSAALQRPGAGKILTQSGAPAIAGAR